MLVIVCICCSIVSGIIVFLVLLWVFFRLIRLVGDWWMLWWIVSCMFLGFGMFSGVGMKCGIMLEKVVIIFSFYL